MNSTDNLAETMRVLRNTAAELNGQMRKANDLARQARSAAASCVGGNCSTGPQREDAGRRSSAAGTSLFSASAVRAAISGDWRAALSSMLGSLSRNIAGQLGQAVGGGLGGSLISSLVGGGLSVLLGRLFRKRQQVTVDNTVRAEVLNFPRITSLDLASNPASRLFSGRAVSRGPAFSVEVSYRGGAEELVSAKVASRLAQLNFLQGVK